MGEFWYLVTVAKIGELRMEELQLNAVVHEMVANISARDFTYPRYCDD